MATNHALLSAATATGAGNAFQPKGANKSFYVVGRTTAGAGSATVKIQVCNKPDGTWIDLATVTLTLSTSDASDGFAAASGWTYYRANVTAISGTGASVDAIMGVEL